MSPVAKIIIGAIIAIIAIPLYAHVSPIFILLSLGGGGLIGNGIYHVQAARR